MNTMICENRYMQHWLWDLGIEMSGPDIPRDSTLFICSALYDYQMQVVRCRTKN